MKNNTILLERMKLLSRYDPSKTLNENVETTHSGSPSNEAILIDLGKAVDSWGTNADLLTNTLLKIANIQQYKVIDGEIGNYTEYDSILNMLKGELGVGNSNDIVKIKNHFDTKLGLHIKYKQKTLMGGNVGIDGDSIQIVEKPKPRDPGVVNDILTTFPCISSTQGYNDTGSYTHGNRYYFKVNETNVALAVDGTTHVYNNSQWEKQEAKTTCPKETIDENFNLNETDAIIPGVTIPDTKTNSSTNTATNSSTNTTTLATDTTILKTSDTNNVTEFQKMLKDAGGEIASALGKTGPNNDGVDGKLGPNTALAAWRYIKEKK